MEKNQEWFRLLVEHTKRQSDIAHFQILVSFGFAGFVWTGKPPVNTVVWLLFFIYLIFALYITFVIYRIQDRRLTLWRLIAINENINQEILNKSEGGLFKGIRNLFRMLDSCYTETDPKKIQTLYIEKIKPSKKRVVCFLHILANLCALSIILFYIFYNIKK